MIGDFLKQIVMEASNLITDNFEVKQKGLEHDLVTNLDLKIERFLIDKIKDKYPNFSIVSEEYNTDNKETDDCFIIDPIDGTVNFSNHIPIWGIQVACKKDGKMIASVIYLPKLNELYYANETGAYLNDKKINIKEVKIKNALYTVGGTKKADIIKKIYNYSKNIRIFGATCASYAFLASGKIHGVVFRKDTPWDYEPGIYLCKQAGAAIKNTKMFHGAAMNEEFLNILEKNAK